MKSLILIAAIFAASVMTVDCTKTIVPPALRQHTEHKDVVVHRLTGFAGQPRYAFQDNSGMWVYLLLSNQQFQDPRTIVNNYYSNGNVPNTVAIQRLSTPPEEGEEIGEENFDIVETVADAEPVTEAVGENTAAAAEAADTASVGAPSGDSVAVPSFTEPSADMGSSSGDSGGGASCGGGSTD